MRSFRVLAAAVGALAALCSLTMPVAVASVAAHRLQPLAASITHKVTLADTSIAAPALWTTEVPNRSATFNAVLAWTGTDPAHHLNLMTSTDGLTYFGKRTLVDTAISRPAVSVIAGPTGIPGFILLAWTGTDPAHHLNVLFDVNGHPSKLIVPDTSFTGPALVVDQSMSFTRVYLAWTGTDANHSLNIRLLNVLHNSAGTIIGLGPGQKTILPSGLRSDDGPGLASPQFAQAPHLVITWTVPNSRRIALADATNPAQPQPIFVSFQTAVGRPAFLALVTNNGAGDRFTYVWGWAGTDPRHSLNAMKSSVLTSFPGPVSTFAESSADGPALGIGAEVTAGQLLLAWTGTDPAHHLNVAAITGVL